MLTSLPVLLERGSQDEPTHIVNISSVAARLSPPGEAAYAASKSALATFSECLAAELWDAPLNVHLVNPGVVDTDLFDPALPDNDQFIADDMERLPPTAVLDAVLHALESGAVETWVPEWFADVAKVKVDNLNGFVEGASLYWREKQAGPET